jgi:putative nucleotidyltransferase with HDIG domain
MVEGVAKSSFDRLLDFVYEASDEFHVGPSERAPLFRLIDQMVVFDPVTAKESLQTVPIALASASIKGEFYNYSPDYKSVLIAACLHDIGKTALPKSLIDKSNLGLDWTPLDHTHMQQHVFEGARIVREAGFSHVVERAIEEHHAKQWGTCYGRDPLLSYEERGPRDDIKVADFTDAMMNRTNTRNRHLSRDERVAQTVREYMMLFDDYCDGQALASEMALRILGVRILTSIPQAA